MELRVLEIINHVLANKGMDPLAKLEAADNLRDQIGFTSFDLAELTVRIEDEFDIDIFEEGIVSTVGEIYEKLS